jgi:hypothetical protein
VEVLANVRKFNCPFCTAQRETERGLLLHVSATHRCQEADAWLRTKAKERVERDPPVVRVQKMGAALGITVPKAIAQTLGWVVGVQVRVRLDGETVRVERA